MVFCGCQATQISIQNNEPQSCQELGSAEVACLHKSDCGLAIEKKAQEKKANVAVCCEFDNERFAEDDSGNIGFIHTVQLYRCDT